MQLPFGAQKGEHASVQAMVLNLHNTISSVTTQEHAKETQEEHAKEAAVSTFISHISQSLTLE